ncbi:MULTISPECIES: LysR family transcriptional regulator [Pandoraea]|uniref:LysR family transcriptional regulator n=1 Tax=Pandoraea communis TaxID=2508297 RepID=A0A5E4RAI2_9BURK|nr:MULTISPECIES: LysR family transcriptional regulator [Pandoraea]EON13828.1 LysR family transcriptional regulator [Pandoraea sp. SD6-2]MDM8359580.1 LysR family transcriptional regulator [Pandoraea communis]VVD59128.1 LysR family transcriptional regulator [Pandoraea communis]
MDAIDQARAFLVVAETGGFSAAAKHLQVVPSVITKRVSQLEAQIGRQLFVRTTRRVELTATGKAVLSHARDLVQAHDRMMGDISNDVAELSGRLRVKAPSALTYLHFSKIINRFLVQHPKVILELLLIDRPVNPVTEGFDLVITGLPPSYDQIEEIALFPIQRMLFASPSYLAQKGTPLQAEDLANHRCLQYSYLSPGVTWTLKGIRGQVDVHVNSTFQTNDIKVMYQAVVDGLGIGILPNYVAQEAIDSGTLVQVLENFALPEFWFRAQFARSQRQRRLLMVLIDHIQDELRSLGLAGPAGCGITSDVPTAIAPRE